MRYADGHPNTTLSDWQTFRKECSPYLIAQVIDRSTIQLPDWFVPLARGVAIASHALLRRAGQVNGFCGWRKTDCDVFSKFDVQGSNGGQANLVVRQFRNQRWWTIERMRADRRYQDVSDVLVYLFGSTPIFAWNGLSAMQLAEYCHVNEPPVGLRWIAACPDDKVGAIEFTEKRRIDEARTQLDGHLPDA